MSKSVQVKQARTLEEKYAMLKKTLAHYLLLQVGTFVAAAGYDAIGPAMNILTDKKAELKVQEIQRQGPVSGHDAIEALSANLAESMGETFQSEYDTEASTGVRTVRLGLCGCIESVRAMAEHYGLTKSQARSIFCSTCMSSYRKAAQSLGVGFKGQLVGECGCMMSFSTAQSHSRAPKTGAAV